MKTQKIQTVVRACIGYVLLGDRDYFGQRAIICEKAFYEVTKCPFKLQRGDVIEITFTPHRGGKFFVDTSEVSTWISRVGRSRSERAPIQSLGFDLPKGQCFRGQFRVRLINHKQTKPRKQDFYHD